MNQLKNQKADCEKSMQKMKKENTNKPKMSNRWFLATIASFLALVVIALGGCTFTSDNEPSDEKTITNEEQVDENDKSPESQDTSGQIVTALESERYSEAMNLVANADKDNLRVLLVERLNTLLNDFRNRDIEYPEVTIELDVIEQMNVFNLENELSNKRNEFEELNSSRVAFDTAEALLEKSEFVDAINQYKNVIHDDPDYDRAVKGRMNATSAYRIQMIESADDYATSKDYINAIKTLNDALEVLNDDASINEKQILYKNQYKENIISDAEDAFISEGYEAAIVVLRNGLSMLPGDSEIKNAITEYGLYKPVYISNYEVFHKTYSLSIDKEVMDKYKNEYRHSISIDKGGSVQYYTNKEYTKFRGIIALPNRDGHSRLHAIIDIYGDDVLLYTSQPSGVNTSPQNFDIDIAGVEMIKIRWTLRYGNDPGNNLANWGYYATLFDAAFYIK